MKWLLGILIGCENPDCLIWWGVKPESSRTMYHWNGEGEDPNRDVWLCRRCAKEHHEHWDDMWAQVPSW
jgi:hypothetical protein